jgi:hypothetical protein
VATPMYPLERPEEVTVRCNPSQLPINGQSRAANPAGEFQRHLPRRRSASQGTAHPQVGSDLSVRVLPGRSLTAPPPNDSRQEGGGHADTLQSSQ